MKNYIEEIISNLNIISRLAIIENAPLTSKMTNMYLRLLKYRWNEEGKSVLAAVEMEMVGLYCELYKMKKRETFDYTIVENENKSLKTIFLPHYCILTFFNEIVTIIQEKNKNISLEISINEKDGKVQIELLFLNCANVGTIKEQMTEEDGTGWYESISRAKCRWFNVFGEDSIEFNIIKQQQSNLYNIQVMFYCE